MKNSKSDVEVNASEAKQKKHWKLSKQARNYLIYAILIVLVTSMALYFLLKENPKEVINTISSARLLPILAMFGLMIVVIMITGIDLTILTRLYNKKYHAYQGVLNGLIGSFFSNITPFASGGQFVQAYTFTRQNVKVANAASILVMQFIIYQTVLLIYGMVAFFAGFNVISRMGMANIFGLKLPPITLSIIGFVINSFTILSLFFLAYCRPLHRVILNGGINLFAKLKLVKDPQKKRENLSAQIATFRIELKRLMSNVPALALVFVMIIIKMTCLNSLPYFAGLATGVDMSGEYLNCVWSSSYLAMITSFIPIPGGSGGAEWGFQTLFANIYGSQSITAACNILWRGISYYLTTLIGGLVFIFYRGQSKVNTMKVADTQTFIDLNLTTLLKRDPGSTFEMMDRKNQRYDKKHPQLTVSYVMTNEEVLSSFEQMKNKLDRTEPEKDTSMTVEISKKYLRRALEETNRIEEEDRDEEVLAAIEEDRNSLKEVDEEKEKKRQKRLEKKKNKRDKTHSGEENR